MEPTQSSESIQQEAFFGMGKPKAPANFRYTSLEQLSEVIDEFSSERAMREAINNRMSPANVTAVMDGDSAAWQVFEELLSNFEQRGRNLLRDINTASTMGWWDESSNIGAVLRKRVTAVLDRVQWLRDNPTQFLSKVASGVAIVTTASAIGKKQSRAWTAGLFSEAKAPKGCDTLLTEEALEKVKKHDVVDVSRKDKDIEDTTEKQLDKEHEDKKPKIAELALDKTRVKKPVEVVTEVGLEKQHNPKASEGDKPKLTEELDKLEEKRDKANKAFQKSN